MTLTNEQLSARRIGGSDAAIIMTGEHFGRTPLTLWEEKTGRREPEDLTWVLRVQMGVTTEALNRKWYTHETGVPVLLHEPLTHTEYSYITANLDGCVKVNGSVGIFEAKHIGAFNKADPAESYYWQLIHYMAVTGWGFAHLSVFQGTDKWFLVEVPRNEEHVKQLVERESAFWWSVENDEPPAGWEPVSAPKINATREVDVSAEPFANEWASHAAGWLENRTPAKMFENAQKGIKALVPDDAGRAFGFGVECKRAKNGSLTIRELEA